MSRGRGRGGWRATVTALAVLLAACSPKGSYQAMADQPRYEAYEGSDHLRHGASVQPLVPGVVARGHLRDDTLLFTGLGPDGNPSEAFPFEVTRAVLERGQTQYNVFCTPCHDYAGTGGGIAVERGYPAPPSLHTEAARQAPAGLIFGVITDGVGQMPSYAEQVAARDRWSIVAYVRALQLSQNARVEDVPAEERPNILPPREPMP